MLWGFAISFGGIASSCLCIIYNFLHCIIRAFKYFCEGLYEELPRSIARVLVAHVRNRRKQQQFCPQRPFAVGCARACLSCISLCRFGIFSSFLKALNLIAECNHVHPNPLPPSFVSFLTCHASCCSSPHYRRSPASASPGPLCHMFGPCAATGTRIAAPG